jgi:hypothetical protein
MHERVDQLGLRLRTADAMLGGSPASLAFVVASIGLALFGSAVAHGAREPGWSVSPSAGASLPPPACCALS